MTAATPLGSLVTPAAFSILRLSLLTACFGFTSSVNSTRKLHAGRSVSAFMT